MSWLHLKPRAQANREESGLLAVGETCFDIDATIVAFHIAVYIVVEPVQSHAYFSIRGEGGAVRAVAHHIVGTQFGVYHWSPFYIEGAIVEIEECHCTIDRKSTRLNSSHQIISYAVFC